MEGYKAMKKILTISLLCISMHISADADMDHTMIQTKLDTIITNVNSIKTGVEDLLNKIKPFVDALKDTTSNSQSATTGLSILPPSLTNEVKITPIQTEPTKPSTDTPTNSVDNNNNNNNNQTTTPPQEATLLTPNEPSEPQQDMSNNSALVVNTPGQEMQPVDLSVQVNEAQPEQPIQDTTMQPDVTNDQPQVVPTEEENQQATADTTVTQEQQTTA